MSNVIAFLESMGQDASLRHADSGLLQSVVARAIDDASARMAILEGDRPRLEGLTGATTNICCGLAPSKKEDEGEEEQEPSKEDEITWRDSRRVA